MTSFLDSSSLACMTSSRWKSIDLKHLTRHLRQSSRITFWPVFKDDFKFIQKFHNNSSLCTWIPSWDNHSTYCITRWHRYTPHYLVFNQSCFIKTNEMCQFAAWKNWIDIFLVQLDIKSWVEFIKWVYQDIKRVNLLRVHMC